MAQTQFQTPPPFLQGGIGITPKGIEQINAMFKYLMEGLPIPGDNTIDIVTIPGVGRAISTDIPDLQNTMGGGDVTYPFQVTLSEVDGTWFAATDAESSLLKSAQPNDNQTIAGLGNENAIPILGSGDLVYLDIQWDPNITGAITSCRIQSFGSGGSFDPTLAAWSSGNSYVFDDGGTPPIQQGLSVPIAQITFDVEGSPTLIPLTVTNLYLELTPVELIPAYLAKPFYGRYQA